MAILKCKMCSGELDVIEGVTVIKCEYCGTKQTVPTSKDENLQGLFNRANILRMKSEFDKAEQLYEKIIEKDDTQAEAYWGLILCKYGIEYVEDPTTFKRIPTCHRTSFDSIIADEDYKSALAHADSVQRGIYEAEAKEIDRIQKGILELSQKEEPYDVFICYKETDNDGKRTQDSVIANDIYHQLTQEGLKVFYAAITLENKLGSAYEPCIFAALNSAKVMLAIGTKPEHFNAVWVKNEWSRFLKIIQKDRSKLLIPCYRDMDAYELPEEFAHLQAQDMSKIGFINDIVRGIKKVVMPDAKEVPVQIENANGNVKALLDRGFMALEDGEWERADEFFEQVLNFDAKLAQAYLGKLMAELRVKKQEDLKNYKQPFDHSNNFQKAVRFADDNLKNTLGSYIEYINKRNLNESLANQYMSIMRAMDMATTEEDYKSVAERFAQMGDYNEAPRLSKECYEKAEIARKDEILSEGNSQMTSDVISDYEYAITIFKSISGWKDADDKIYACQKRIEEIKKKEEQKRIEKEKQAEAERIEKEKQEQAEREEKERIAKRNKKIAIITTPIVCIAIAFLIILNSVIIPNNKYNNAIKLIEEEKYVEALPLFGAARNIKDASELYKETLMLYTDKLLSENKYEEALLILSENKNTANISEKYAEILTLCVDKWKNHLASDGTQILGLKENGTVEFAGARGIFATDYTKSLSNIVAVEKEEYYSLALKGDGTVVASQFNGSEDFYHGQCNISDWRDIVKISSAYGHTVGLRKDGTVIATEYIGDMLYYQGECNVSGWTDIVDVSTGDNHTIGLKKDGTVVATKFENTKKAFGYEGQCDVYNWKDIVAISAGSFHTVGLKADGTVVAVGRNGYGQCNVSDWKDIVAISAGSFHTVGLKADGTVVATSFTGEPKYYHGQSDVSDWTDIIAIYGGENETVGLRADGTVVVTRYNEKGTHYDKFNVKDWNLFK